MMNSKVKIDKITKDLIILKEIVRLQNSANFTDINIVCENIVCELLNIAYNYNLINANGVKTNQSVYDLIDSKRKICFQVTSTNTNAKIQKTLTGFKNIKESEEYQIKFFIIGKKKNYTTEFEYAEKLSFDKKRDILDDTDITKAIFNDTNKIDRAYEFLKKEVDGNDDFVDLKSYEKKENYEIEFFSKRYFVKENGENSWFRNDLIGIEELIKNYKNIVIMGDAGTGKSEVCKYIFNLLNKEDGQFPLYYKLLYYTGQDIEKIKSPNFEKLPNKFVTFILDGYDEIEDSYKSIFIKKINDFVDKNKGTKIILTTRTNFYQVHNTNNFLPEFEIYSISNFDDINIKEITNYYNVDYQQFMTELEKSNIKNFIYNPFYSDHLVKYYGKHGKLIDKGELIDNIIEESFARDIKKYSTSKDIVKRKILSILKLLSFSMALLEKNYLTDEELEILIKNNQDRELLNYLSLWENKDGNHLFIHNIFFEYLASKVLKCLPVKKVKEIIYNNDYFNPFWVNILSLYLLDNYNLNFVEWLLDKYPNFVFYLDYGQIDKKTRVKLVKDTFNYYEHKKIWISNLIYYNTSFLHNISDEEILEFLLSKLDITNHRTVIYNALTFLNMFDKFEGMSEKVKLCLMDKILLNSDFDNSQKEIALEILSKHKMIDFYEFEKIVQYNKYDDQKNVKMYIYYFKINKINEENINLFLEVLKELKNDYSLSINNYLKSIFSNLNNKNIINKVLKEIENIHTFSMKKILSDENVKDICYSIHNTYLNKTDKTELYIQLFEVCQKLYLNKYIKIISEFLSEDGLKLDFFISLIDNKIVNRYLYLDDLIDEDCLKYFYDNYEAGNYSYLDASNILYVCNKEGSKYYQKINEKYFDDQGFDIINDRKQKIKTQNDSQKQLHKYFDSIFDKDKFQENITSFLNLFAIQEPISKKELSKLDVREYSFDRNNNIIYDFLNDILDDEYLSIKDIINKINWDYFILHESYRLLIRNNDLKLSQEQSYKIDCICHSYLMKDKYDDWVKCINKINIFTKKKTT